MKYINKEKKKILQLNLISVAIVLLTIFIGIAIITNRNSKIFTKLSVSKQLLQIEFYMIPLQEDTAFNIKKAASNEILKGIHGPYYLIDLKDPITNHRLYFEKGKYFFPENDRRLLIALNDVNNKIIRFIAKETDFKMQIFVQGQADFLSNATFEGEFEKNIDSFIRIEYCPFIEQYSYDTIKKVRSIHHKFTNEDLTYLRSAYISKRIEAMFENVKSTIIEGNVTKQINDSDRNGTILLYIDTFSQKNASPFWLKNNNPGH